LASAPPCLRILTLLAILPSFDHNKDHVLDWAKELYADEKAKHYFAGVGVHWYGGLNTDNLKQTHLLAPDKFILATEACNCGGVVYQAPDVAQWWSRAESLGLDILEVNKNTGGGGSPACLYATQHSGGWGGVGALRSSPSPFRL
jgi:glucosylceramidase